MRKLALALVVLLAACTAATPPRPAAAVPAAAAASPASTRMPVAPPAPEATAPSAADAEVDRLARAYTIEFLRRNPSVNTYLGGAGLDASLVEVDGTLRDVSIDALSIEDHAIGDVASALDRIDPAMLSPGRRIDREVALAQIHFQLHQHQVRSYQRRSLDTYTDEPFRSIDFQLQGMTQTGPSSYGSDDEWRRLSSRLADIPRYLKTAQEQLQVGIAALTTPDFRMLYRNGIRTTEADAVYFEKTLPQIAADRISGPNRAARLAEINTRSVAAAAAYRGLKRWVAATFFDDPSKESGVKPQFAGDRFMMGEPEYNWALGNNLRVKKSAAQLYDESWGIVQTTQQKLVDLSRQIGTAHGWALPADGNAAVRKVFDELSKDYPKSDAEMIAWYRDAAFRLVDYARKTGVFDVPADYKLEVVETPAPLRASIDGAAYYPAPPFRDSGVGRYYVTPTDNDAALLQQNNRSALADLSAHEGFPGHDWYYKIQTQSRSSISPVRWLTPGAVEDSSSMWEDSMAAEGWGLYSEALMAEPATGAPGGFYTPEEHLYQLQGKLYRDLRVRVDIGLHTGRLKYADAVDLFSQTVDFLPGSCRDAAAVASEAKRASCTSSEAAIFRYSKWPTQAITYRLGMDEIFDLRTRAAQQQGARFSPKQFHLLFIRQGTIPAGYFGEELLKQMQ